MWMILTNYYQVKLINNLLGLKYLFLSLAIIWTFIVSFLCLVNFNDLPDIPVMHLDKLGHATFHFGITTLWFLYFNSKQNGQLRKSVVTAFLFSLVYGFSIEVIQNLFTATRHGDVLDVLANVTGASIAVLLILIIASIAKKPA